MNFKQNRNKICDLIPAELRNHVNLLLMDKATEIIIQNIATYKFQIRLFLYIYE